MAVKNEIEKLFVRMTKWLRGKGPDNIIVKITEDAIVVYIHGITSNMEIETIRYFPEYEPHMIELRKKLFQKRFAEHKDRFEEMIERKLIGSEFEYSYKEDKAVLCFKTESK